MDQEAKFATKTNFSKGNSMSSTAQAIANIENAQKSTGPRTEAGKAASSLNALKHGLTAQTVLLPGEDEVAYQRLCADTFENWNPIKEQEKALVQSLCDTQWRITRCARLEAVILSAEIPNFKALDIISKHETRLKKLFSLTLKEAHDLIFTRRANHAAMMKDAMTLRRADKLKERPTDFKAVGFDFSVQEVEVAITREDTLLRARKTVSQQAGR
jgi:hypothetical protein